MKGCKTPLRVHTTHSALRGGANRRRRAHEPPRRGCRGPRGPRKAPRHERDSSQGPRTRRDQQLSERQPIAPPRPPTGTTDGRAYSTGPATRAARAAGRGQDSQEAPRTPHGGVAPAGSNRAPAGSALYGAAPAGSGLPSGSYYREAPEGSALPRGDAPAGSDPTPAGSMLAPAGGNLHWQAPNYAGSDPMPADSAANDHKEVGSNQGVQAALTALMQPAQRIVALQHFVAAQIGAEAPRHAREPPRRSCRARHLQRAVQRHRAGAGSARQRLRTRRAQGRAKAAARTTAASSRGTTQIERPRSQASDRADRSAIQGEKSDSRTHSAVTNVSSPCPRSS